MTHTAHLALDLGAESGRAVVGVLDNDRLELHEVHRFGHRPCRLPGGLHWGLTDLWHGVLDGLTRAAAFAARSALSLESVGVDTWGVDFALLSQSGELLGLPRCYRDERNIAAFDRTVERIGAERLYEETGIQPLPINTIFQLVARRQSDAGLLEQAAALLFMPDLMHYLLTGHVAVEATIASTSQMIDPRTGRWAVDLVTELGLPAQILQPLVPAGTRLGAVRPEVAQEAGIKAELPVIAPASHDTASAVAAVPAAAGSSWCYLSSGTWSLLGAELPAPCLSPAARDAPFTNEGGVGGTIRFLKNITGLWLVQECRRSLEQKGAALDYAALTELARAAPPFRTLIDPAHGPFLTPGRMPEKIAAYAQSTGQPAPDDSGALIRCCLESLALAYRHTLIQLEVVLGRTTDVLHVVGGGGRNTLLNQMTADAIDRPVRVGPVEATAAGNVLVQAMGAGLVRDLPHLRTIVASSFEPELYEPCDAGAWQGPYARFVELLDTTAGQDKPVDATQETVR